MLIRCVKKIFTAQR